MAARGAPTQPRCIAAGLGEIARNRPLVVFAICVGLFHLANAAMLPLAANMLTLRSSEAATIMVAAAMVLIPQFTVTLLSPWVGRTAHRLGRRPLLLFGFGALFVRGLLFAMTSEPRLLVAIQVLDGVSAGQSLFLGVLGCCLQSSISLANTGISTWRRARSVARWGLARRHHDIDRLYHRQLWQLRRVPYSDGARGRRLRGYSSGDAGDEAAAGDRGVAERLKRRETGSGCACRRSVFDRDECSLQPCGGL